MKCNHDTSLKKFYALFFESLQLKDWGLLKSALKKREEATQLMQNNPGYYAIGKANEASLLGHHIGDGLKAYEATKESLKNIKALVEVEKKWKAKTTFSVLPDCLVFIGNWVESYEKIIEYSELANRWTNIPIINERLQQIYDRQAKGMKWGALQRATSYNFYNRTMQERDRGKHASAMAMLHCILDRVCEGEAGYEMNPDEIFDILDDYIGLAIQAYRVIFQKFYIALQNGAPLADVDGADEQFIIFQNPLKYWLELMPDCPEKFKPVFQKYYEQLMQIPYPVYPEVMQQIGAFFPDARVETKVCRHCGHTNSIISPICVQCTRLFDGSSITMPSAAKSNFRIDKVPAGTGIKTPQPNDQLPFGCAIAVMIIKLLFIATLWWWAIWYGEVRWYGILIAVICSLFIIANLSFQIKEVFNLKK